MSTIKVHGEQTLPGRSFIADVEPVPTYTYAISEWEAEEELLEISCKTGLEVVIIRSVFVYGVGVKANFLNMMRWLHKGVPLPFWAIHNRRSLVALDNLVDLIVACIDNPAAANQTFLVSDGEDLSTTELLRRMGAVLGTSALLQRLCGSQQVDISKARELLNWTPPLNVDEALRRTAKHFLE